MSQIGISSVAPALAETIRAAVDSGDPDIEYFGYAVPGTATSAAAWRIFRIDDSAGIVKQFADSNANYDNIWDNRESLSYA